MNVLVVAAHPDDELLGPGATLAKRVKAGDRVDVCIITEGATTRNANVKLHLDCASRANKRLGVRKVFFLKLKDQKLDTYPSLAINQKIEKVVKKVEPEVVYTHHWGDLNLDHRIAFDSAMVACRPFSSKVRSFFCFETVSSTEWAGPSRNFIPNYFEDVEDFFDDKIEAFLEYSKTTTNEVKGFPHPRSIENLEALAKKRGSEAGLVKAEAFELIRHISMG